ncbi:hypothetical protein M3Y94_01065000 [Aphelenchoides besseyi]|nr:hypothetical protein M3Y94_01065000 [Aphelenchoides besseyi]KAI6224212.1 hypothetical protein M3Y95_00859000 [Aphelenchoides besseyi]
MARFFNVFAFVALALVLILSTQTEARPYADASISGTILSPMGGALGGYSAPYYSNAVQYNPYGGYGFFG